MGSHNLEMNEDDVTNWKILQKSYAPEGSKKTSGSGSRSMLRGTCKDSRILSLHEYVDFFNTVDGNKFPKDTFFRIKIIKMHIFLTVFLCTIAFKCFYKDRVGSKQNKRYSL